MSSKKQINELKKIIQADERKVNDSLPTGDILGLVIIALIAVAALSMSIYTYEDNKNVFTSIDITGNTTTGNEEVRASGKTKLTFFADTGLSITGTDTDKKIEFVNIGGGGTGTPGVPANSVQFNAGAGTFGGSGDLLFSGSTLTAKNLTVTTQLIASSLVYPTSGSPGKFLKNTTGNILDFADPPTAISYGASSGLSLSGTSFSVVAGDGIDVNSAGVCVRITDDYNLSFYGSELGVSEILTGVSYQGHPVQIEYGGTGIKSIGMSQFFYSADGTSISPIRLTAGSGVSLDYGPHDITIRTTASGGGGTCYGVSVNGGLSLAGTSFSVVAGDGIDVNSAGVCVRITDDHNLSFYGSELGVSEILTGVSYQGHPVQIEYGGTGIKSIGMSQFFYSADGTSISPIRLTAGYGVSLDYGPHDITIRTTASGGISSPAGSTTQIQYNGGGNNFGADSSFTWTGSQGTSILGVSGNIHLTGGEFLLKDSSGTSVISLEKSPDGGKITVHDSTLNEEAITIAVTGTQGNNQILMKHYNSSDNAIDIKTFESGPNDASITMTANSRPTQAIELRTTGTNSGPDINLYDNTVTGFGASTVRIYASDNTDANYAGGRIDLFRISNSGAVRNEVINLNSSTESILINNSTGVSTVDISNTSEGGKIELSQQDGVVGITAETNTTGNNKITLNNGGSTDVIQLEAKDTSSSDSKITLNNSNSQKVVEIFSKGPASSNQHAEIYLSETVGGTSVQEISLRSGVDDRSSLHSGGLIELSKINKGGTITVKTIELNGADGEIIFKNDNPGASVTFGISANQSTPTNFILPIGNGNSGYVLQTDGSGITSWVQNTGGTDGATSLGGLTDTKVDASNLILGNTAPLLDPNKFNTGVGISALFSLTGTGTSNTALGYDAAKGLTSGDSNIAIGVGSLITETTGNYSTAVGFDSLKVQAGISGNDAYNTAVGYNAGLGNTSGYQNTFIGACTGTCVTGIIGHNITCLGYGAQPSSLGVSNEVTLGNTLVDTLRCADTTITSLSDRRDKTDIRDTIFGLDFLEKVRPVDFTWNRRVLQEGDENHPKNGKRRTGFIAQELLEASGEEGNQILDLVYQSNPERIEAKYGNLIPSMVKSIQELSKKVESLEKRLEKLE